MSRSPADAGAGAGRLPRVAGPAATGRRHRRSPGGCTALLVPAAAGALAGAAAKAADESTWTWAADLGTYPAAWVLAVAVVGRAAPSAVAAGVRAAVFFAIMTAAYYAWAVGVLGFGPGVWRLAALWWVASATAVPVFAVLVHLAARTRTRRWPLVVLAGAALAAAGGLALADGTALQLWRAAVEPAVEAGAGPRLRPVQAAASVVAALVVAVGLARSRRVQWVGLALLVPAAWASPAALAAAHASGVLPG